MNLIHIISRSRRLLIVTLISVLLVYFGFKQLPIVTDPEDVLIFTSDIENFWQAFDRSKPDFDPQILKEYYFEKASPGLKKFINHSIKNEEQLSNKLKKYKGYYESIREITFEVHRYETDIRNSFEKLKQLYPKSKFPPVYFVIGSLNSGGTTAWNGLIIGAEMYGESDSTNTDQLSAWHKSVIQPVKEIEHIVAHEIIHYQQRYDGHDLLSACIKEGAADFMAELISGNHINDHVHQFANSHESILWSEFYPKRHEKDFHGWLYSTDDNRPQDLGYWMGYKIVKSYFDSKTNKEKAIKEILNIKDFDKFLLESGYPDKFKTH